MAEEPNDEKKGGSPIVRYAAVGGLVILVPTILALLVFQFILRPMLGSETPPEPEEVIEGVIPAGAVPLSLPEVQGAVLPDDPDSVAPVLIYQVAFICADQITSDMITANMVYFQAMIDKLHRNRTRSELNDPQVQTTILKRAEQEANTWLKRLAPESDFEVLEVMYVKFGMIDL